MWVLPSILFIINCRLLTSAALLFLAVSMACCGGPAGERTDSTVVLRNGIFIQSVTATGEIQASKFYSIKAPVTEFWQIQIEYLAPEGSYLKEGDRLVEFESSASLQQITDKENQIEAAEEEIQRQKASLNASLKDLETEVYRKKIACEKAVIEADIDPSVVSRRRFQELTLAVDAARLDLENADKAYASKIETGKLDLAQKEIEKGKLEKDLYWLNHQLKLLTMEAPIDGMVIYGEHWREGRKVQPGDSVFPNMEIIKLPDLSRMEALAFVNEVDGKFLQKGQHARIILDAYPDKIFHGKVQSVSNMAEKIYFESSVKIFRAICSIKTLDPGLLKPGMSARVEIITERIPESWIMPREGVMVKKEKQYIRPERGGPREITVIGRNANAYRIKDPGFKKDKIPCLVQR